jgi:hypothetical protein
MDLSIVTYTGFFKWVSIFAVCVVLVYLWLRTYPSPRFSLHKNKYYFGAFFWWVGLMCAWGLMGMPISLNAFNPQDVNYNNVYVNAWEIIEWCIFLGLFGFAYIKGIIRDDKFKAMHDPRITRKSNEV